MPEFDFSEGETRLAAAMGGGATQARDGARNRGVPFIAQMHEFSMAMNGARGDRFYTDAETFVRGICTTARDFGFDTPSFVWDAYNIEAEALGARLVLFEDMAPALDNAAPLIASDADLARLEGPAPARDGRMPMVMEILHLVKEYTGQRPALGFCAPFTMAAHLMTFENLIVQITKNPAFVHRVLDFIVDQVLVPYCDHAHALFPDLPGYDGSDATASLPFITQEMQDEFALAPIRRLQGRVALPCHVDNWWGDSYTRDKTRFWDNKLLATPGYFKIQDPDLWKVGLEDPLAFARERDKPVILGVDNNLFQNGPVEEIEKRIHEYMAAIEAQSGRGAVYFCSLSAVTPREHVEAAVAAAKSFRAGDRPWAGLRRAGTPEARQEKPVTVPVSAAADMADEPREARLDGIYNAVMDYQEETVPRLVNEALAEGMEVHEILDDALISAMDEVGEMFSEGTIFVPEMLLAARAMKAGLQVLRPLLTATKAEPKGKVLLATVQGDVHDIGKNLVGMMLEGAGYTVVDLGVNATKEAILAKAEELAPDVVGLSALLTTSMPAMAKTVAAFKEAGIAAPVIVGGAPVTQDFADAIGAHGYGADAPGAVLKVGELVAARRAAKASGETLETATCAA
ncbi:MAG: cobalamin-dependent protein [Alphaproteobacteria bacterium]